MRNLPKRIIKAANTKGKEKGTCRVKHLVRKITKAVISGGYRYYQMFDCRNTTGDYMRVLWRWHRDPSVTVEYAPGYGYVEVLGVSDEVYRKAYRLTH